MSYPPIENHGVIGDMETAALVRTDGAIDFMCFPCFDSPTIFASLLDAANGGFFQVAPISRDFHCHQSYRPNTNILDTTFRSTQAIAVVSDFMTVETSGRQRCLVRHVKTV
jgi:GH15 family glucan-1,4-alpha-glucosidase